MTLMSRTTGKSITDGAHLVQSIEDILTTPLNTRVTVRDYGCLLPYLVDKPINNTFAINAFRVIIEALTRWEPRFTIALVSVNASQISRGFISLTLEGLYKPLGRVIKLENITLDLSRSLST